MGTNVPKQKTIPKMPYGDMIYRQEAIDELMDSADYLDTALDCIDCVGRLREKLEFGLELIQEIIERLKGLPSAQPEPRWIPCSERLPEKDGYYLTTTCYRQVYNDFWNEDHFDRTEAVIAWMTLPEPYQVEGDINEIN